MNAALRYKAWGDDGSVSLRFADPFGIERYGYRTANGSVIELNERYNGTRAVFLAVTRNFGRPVRLRSQSEAENQGSGVAP